MIGSVHAERAATALGRSEDPFEVAVFAFSEPGSPETVQAYADAGATWWLESLSPMRGSMEALLAVVKAGPPRLA